MRWIRHGICGWLGGVIVVTLSTSPVNAAPPSIETEVSTPSVGRDLIDAGDAARERGAHGEAIELWTQAYDSVPASTEYAALRRSILGRIISARLTMHVSQAPDSRSRTARDVTEACALLLGHEPSIYDFESRLALAHCDAIRSANERELEAARASARPAERKRRAPERLIVKMKLTGRHYYVGSKFLTSSEVALLTALGHHAHAKNLRVKRAQSISLLTIGGATLLVASLLPLSLDWYPDNKFIAGETLLAIGGLGLLVGGAMTRRRMPEREVMDIISDYNGEARQPRPSRKLRRPRIALYPRHHGIALSLTFSL